MTWKLNLLKDLELKNNLANAASNDIQGEKFLIKEVTYCIPMLLQATDYLAIVCIISLSFIIVGWLENIFQQANNSRYLVINSSIYKSPLSYAKDTAIYPCYAFKKLPCVLSLFCDKNK